MAVSMTTALTEEEGEGMAFLSVVRVGGKNEAKRRGEKREKE